MRICRVKKHVWEMEGSLSERWLTSLLPVKRYHHVAKSQVFVFVVRKRRPFIKSRQTVESLVVDLHWTLVNVKALRACRAENGGDWRKTKKHQARSVLTYPVKAEITITTNAHCTSTTKLSMVFLLLIKGLRFRTMKTKTPGLRFHTTETKT